VAQRRKPPRAHLNPEWRKLLRYAWTVRIALMWGAVSGLWVALPAFQDTVDPVLFAVACMAVSVVIVIARITKQPGLNL